MANKKVLVGEHEAGTGFITPYKWVTGDTLVDPDGNPISTPSIQELSVSVGSFHGGAAAHVTGISSSAAVYADVPLGKVTVPSYFWTGQNSRATVQGTYPNSPAYSGDDNCVMVIGGDHPYGGGNATSLVFLWIDEWAIFYDSGNTRWEARAFGQWNWYRYDGQGYTVDFSTTSGINLSRPAYTTPATETDYGELFRVWEAGTRFTLVNGSMAAGVGQLNGRLYISSNILRADLQFIAQGTAGGYGESGYRIRSYVRAES